MQQLQTEDMFRHNAAVAQIARYRDIQAEHREALDEIDKGIRHFDPGPGGYMVETTKQYRQRRLDAIAGIERWVKVWERDLAVTD